MRIVSILRHFFNQSGVLVFLRLLVSHLCLKVRQFLLDQILQVDIESYACLPEPWRLCIESKSPYLIRRAHFGDLVVNADAVFALTLGRADRGVMLGSQQVVS